MPGNVENGLWKFGVGVIESGKKERKNKNRIKKYELCIHDKEYIE